MSSAAPRARRLGNRTALAPLALLALLVACERGQQERPVNVMLVSIDTLRADHLEAYGYPRPTSPRVTELASHGTLFMEALSASSWTIPSHATMLTGQYSSVHGVDGLRKALPEHLPTLADWFGAAGFETAAIVNARVLQHAQGRTLFEHFEEVPPNMRLVQGKAPKVNGAVLRWLQSRRDPERRFFLFVHYYDVHSDYTALPKFRDPFAEPYSGPARGTNRQLVDYFSRSLDHWGPDDARHLRNLYDAGIRQLDARLGALFDELRWRGILDETAVLITSDHGEEFLEHGSVLHSRTLYEEQLRIPLLVLGPGVPKGLRVSGPVSLIDVAPTVLALANLPLPDGLAGLDLRRAWLDPGDWPPQRALFAETDEWVGRIAGGFRRAIYRGDWKLLYDHPSGQVELYDLSTDPAERHDLSGEKTEVRDRLRSELDGFNARKRATGDSLEIDAETAEHLRALGYAP